MPHVIVKMYAGRSEQQKKGNVENIYKKPGYDPMRGGV